MRLAHSTRTHQEQTVLVADWKLARETLHNQFCFGPIPVPSGELVRRCVSNIIIRFIALEITMTVVLRNARALQRPLGAIARGAIAGNGPDHFRFAGSCTWTICGERLRAFRRSLDDSPAAAFTMGTIHSRHVGRISVVGFARKVTSLCKYRVLWKARVFPVRKNCIAA